MMDLRRWLDFLFPPRADEAVLRDVSTDEFLGLVSPILVSATSPEAVALLPFSHASVRAAIHEAKYRGSERAFTFLAAALADYLRDYDERSRKTILVPIPLGKERRRERGFNQVHEVTLRALRSLDGEGAYRLVLDPNLLERVRETVSQVSLPRHARKENMRGAFGAAHPANPAYTYIVIDDVLTTGATLQSAADALAKAGATHIIPLALAH
ncbi:MAG: ComF family protein [Patescibacteria group bacterium]|nr:ComF family protein [Patescibacteria group bacterium]